MTNDDKPLDLDDAPFAADIDEPVGPTAPLTAGGETVSDPTEAGPDPHAAVDDDPWGNDPTAPAPVTGSRPVADEWVRPSGQSSSLLLIMGAVILVMVAVVVFLAIKPDDSGDSADPAPAGEAPVAPAPADPGGAVPPPETTPDPGNDPDLDDPAVLTDDFERPGPELGEFAGGTWNNQIGVIEIEDGVMRTAEVDDGSPLLLSTIDIGTTDLTAEVALPSPVDRAGLAFRVATPDRFIGLFATSEYGTYTLARFENGAYDESSIIGNTDLSGVSVGDVIGVRATGSKVEVLTNGTVRNSFDDPKLDIDGTGVGVFAFADDNGPESVDARDFANWDDFSVLAG